MESEKRKRNPGGLAQLGEHLLCKQGVDGSIPSSSTKPAATAKVARVARVVNKKTYQKQIKLMQSMFATSREDALY